MIMWERVSTRELTLTTVGDNNGIYITLNYISFNCVVINVLLIIVTLAEVCNLKVNLHNSSGLNFQLRR